MRIRKIVLPVALIAALALPFSPSVAQAASAIPPALVSPVPDRAAALAATTYTVKKGDSLWKIAVNYQIGLSELKKANPQISNFDLIYAGQKVNIPDGAPLATYESQVITLINKERTSRGLMALKTDWQLSRVARYKSEDMILKNYFDHNSPTYGSPFRMMESFKIQFNAAAENIAMGQRTPAEVVAAWMNSPGHRANILSAVYSHTGVGAAKKSNGTLYWTQMFYKN